MRGVQGDLKKLIHEAIDKKVEASRGINTAPLDKRLGETEKRLTEKMDTLDSVQTADPTCVFHPNLISASEEPVVTISNQLCYCGKYWCVPEPFCLPQETGQLSGWHMWLQGMLIVHNNVTYCIMPL